MEGCLLQEGKFNETEMRVYIDYQVHRLLSEYEKIFICDADNVSSKQFQNIRQGMRGRGDVLMGKNTMMKRAIREMIGQKPELEKLLPLIRQNVGFVMSNGDLKEIRDLVETFTVPAAARSGAIAPVEVTLFHTFST